MTDNQYTDRQLENREACESLMQLDDVSLLIIEAQVKALLLRQQISESEKMPASA